jgi:hypothetical protein
MSQTNSNSGAAPPADEEATKFRDPFYEAAVEVLNYFLLRAALRNPDEIFFLQTRKPVHHELEISANRRDIADILMVFRKAAIPVQTRIKGDQRNCLLPFADLESGLPNLNNPITITIAHAPRTGAGSLSVTFNPDEQAALKPISVGSHTVYDPKATLSTLFPRSEMTCAPIIFKMFSINSKTFSLPPSPPLSHFLARCRQNWSGLKRRFRASARNKFHL